MRKDSPERPSPVPAAAECLQRLFGGEWDGYFMEQSRVPGAALVSGIRRGDAGRRVLFGVLLVAEEAVTSDMLRQVPVAALENSANLAETVHLRAELEELPPLRRSGVSPEDFSKLVAAHYSIWARMVPHPAAAMAAEWEVRLPTMHGWIREARLRGLLPPAKRGKS